MSDTGESFRTLAKKKVHRWLAHIDSLADPGRPAMYAVYRDRVLDDLDLADGRGAFDYGPYKLEPHGRDPYGGARDPLVLDDRDPSGADPARDDQYAALDGYAFEREKARAHHALERAAHQREPPGARELTSRESTLARIQELERELEHERQLRLQELQRLQAAAPYGGYSRGADGDREAARESRRSRDPEPYKDKERAKHRDRSADGRPYAHREPSRHEKERERSWDRDKERERRYKKVKDKAYRRKVTTAPDEKPRPKSVDGPQAARQSYAQPTPTAAPPTTTSTAGAAGGARPAPLLARLTADNLLVVPAGRQERVGLLQGYGINMADADDKTLAAWIEYVQQWHNYYLVNIDKCKEAPEAGGDVKARIKLQIQAQIQDEYQKHYRIENQAMLVAPPAGYLPPYGGYVGQYNDYVYQPCPTPPYLPRGRFRRPFNAFKRFGYMGPGNRPPGPLGGPPGGYRYRPGNNNPNNNSNNVNNNSNANNNPAPAQNATPGTTTKQNANVSMTNSTSPQRVPPPSGESAKDSNNVGQNTGNDKTQVNIFPSDGNDGQEFLNDFYCHVCNTRCGNLQEFDDHMKSLSHTQHMSDIYKLQQIQQSKPNGDAKGDFCNICDRQFHVSLAVHKKTDEHKRKEQLAKDLATRIDTKSDKITEKEQNGCHDNKSDSGIDTSVIYFDESERLTLDELLCRLPDGALSAISMVYDPQCSVGDQFLVPVTGYVCKLCRVFCSEEQRRKMDHCKTEKHFNHYQRLAEYQQKVMEEKAKEAAMETNIMSSVTVAMETCSTTAPPAAMETNVSRTSPPTAREASSMISPPAPLETNAMTSSTVTMVTSAADKPAVKKKKVVRRLVGKRTPKSALVADRARRQAPGGAREQTTAAAGCTEQGKATAERALKPSEVGPKSSPAGTPVRHGVGDGPAQGPPPLARKKIRIRVATGSLPRAAPPAAKLRAVGEQAAPGQDCPAGRRPSLCSRSSEDQSVASECYKLEGSTGSPNAPQGEAGRTKARSASGLKKPRLKQRPAAASPGGGAGQGTQAGGVDRKIAANPVVVLARISVPEEKRRQAGSAERPLGGRCSGVKRMTAKPRRKVKAEGAGDQRAGSPSSSSSCVRSKENAKRTKPTQVAPPSGESQAAAACKSSRRKEQMVTAKQRRAVEVMSQDQAFRLSSTSPKPHKVIEDKAAKVSEVTESRAASLKETPVSSSVKVLDTVRGNLLCLYSDQEEDEEEEEEEVVEEEEEVGEELVKAARQPLQEALAVYDSESDECQSSISDEERRATSGDESGPEEDAPRHEGMHALQDVAGPRHETQCSENPDANAGGHETDEAVAHEMMIYDDGSSEYEMSDSEPSGPDDDRESADGVCRETSEKGPVTSDDEGVISEGEDAIDGEDEESDSNHEMNDCTDDDGEEDADLEDECRPNEEEDRMSDNEEEVIEEEIIEEEVVEEEEEVGLEKSNEDVEAAVIEMQPVGEEEEKMENAEGQEDQRKDNEEGVEDDSGQREEEAKVTEVNNDDLDKVDDGENAEVRNLQTEDEETMQNEKHPLPEARPEDVEDRLVIVAGPVGEEDQGEERHLADVQEVSAAKDESYNDVSEPEAVRSVRETTDAELVRASPDVKRKSRKRRAHGEKGEPGKRPRETLSPRARSKGTPEHAADANTPETADNNDKNDGREPNDLPTSEETGSDHVTPTTTTTAKKRAISIKRRRLARK